MRSPARLLAWYAFAGGAIVGVTVALLSPVLSPAAASGVREGGVAAYLIQLAAFATFVWMGRRRNVLAAWVVGSLARLAAVFGVGLAAWRGALGQEAVAALMLSLVGFLFVLLLLEAAFFVRGIESQSR